MKTYHVYLGTCSDYNPRTIGMVIEEALKRVPLEKSITGKIVIKPNLVMAHPRIATEGYTRMEIIEGILKVIEIHGKNINRIDIVEKSGLGITTANTYRWAGYKRLKRKYPVKCRSMEERPRVKIVLERSRVQPYITIAREMAERDFLIFAPKLKTNVLSHAYSGALKLNIGTIDSKERIYHHNRDLHIKIVDILEAANPDLIITDGIRLSYGGNQMTQNGIDFGVIAVSNNVVAHDMVCARMLNLDPFKIEHIREAMDRGYGPTSFDEIEILGDFSIEKGHEIVEKLDFGFYPVEQFASHFTIHSGKPYCTGGCHGIFLDWLHMIRDRKPKLLKRFPKLTVLIGKDEKRIEYRTILLIGNCAQASTNFKAKKTVRIKGCPPTHKRIVLDMMVHFLLLAPLVRPSLIMDGFVFYPVKKAKGWLMNLRFRPLNSKG